MTRWADLRTLFALSVLLAFQSSAVVRASEADIPASFKDLSREQQTACIELDAINRTHNVECLEERLWRLEHRAFRTPSTTSKPVKERIKALAAELTPSEEIIEEVRTRMAKPKRGKLPPDLVRDKTGIHEVDANAIDTGSSTGVRRSSASGGDGNSAGYAKLSDELGKLEETMAKLKKIAQGDAAASEVDEGSQHDRSPDDSMETDSPSAGRSQNDSFADNDAKESALDYTAPSPSDDVPDSSSTVSSATAVGRSGQYNLPGENEARSVDELGDVAFADLNPSQQLAALEIEHHDKLGTGKTEQRLRQLEIEIMGPDFVSGGKSEAQRLKALNATSPASTLSIKRAVKALKVKGR